MAAGPGAAMYAPQRRVFNPLDYIGRSYRPSGEIIPVGQ